MRDKISFQKEKQYVEIGQACGILNLFYLAAGFYLLFWVVRDPYLYIPHFPLMKFLFLYEKLGPAPSYPLEKQIRKE